ncbi:MAG: AAA family ATPase [Candidatus Helarchaeota archaeon]
MSVSEVRDIAQKVLTELRKVVVGKGEVMQNIFIALLADGHVLLEGVPGVAKTFMANAFAKVLGCSFKRIQFTPDMLPADVTGTNIFDTETNTFKLKKGPIFANIVLADEINRAPPKTQAALLECMQERQVTLEGVTHKLERPFLVLATQNPIELEGTYPLPEAQVDRFLFKLIVGYPTEAEEIEIINRKHSPVDVELNRITNPEILRKMQEAVRHVHVDKAIMAYIRDIVIRTRKDPQILLGGSPRASIVLLSTAKARAAILGRTYVTPDDVKSLALHGLYHRLILKPEAELGGVSVPRLVYNLLEEMRAPI